MRKYFGTDGVRGIANKELTPKLAFKLAQAGGIVLNKQKKDKKNLVLVGSDTRISKDMLKSALISGFTSTGMDVIDLGVTTTPAVAYLSKYYDVAIGAMISASHNPMEYNGIKFFNSDGFKLDDSLELEIEKLIEKNADKLPIGEKVGKIKKLDDINKTYEKYLLDCVNVDLKGYKIVLDTANGSSYYIAPKVFKEKGAQVICIANTPNGININDKCGSTYIDNLRKKVLEEMADFGLAFDGDADRLIAVDEKGETIDGDKIMLMVASYLKSVNKLKNNTLVVTVMSNLGLFKSAEKLGINLEVTSVGDRYVLENMLKNCYNVGGEQSGHIILLDYSTTGDGILSSLILSKVIKESGKSLSELGKIMEIYPQVLVNVKVQDKYKEGYKDISEITDKIKKMEQTLNGEGRVLIRPSGTEPLIRIMLEGKDQGQIEKMARELAVLIEEKCV